MTVSVIWSTPDIDTQLAYIARVSNPENQNNEATAAGLIRYLIKHKHWSPFEMANACLEINTTRDIGRQILRHSLRPQEFSQRYQDVSKLGDPVTREGRLKHPTNRQSSITCEDAELLAQWTQRQIENWETATNHYRWALDNGFALESARVVLPEGNTPTRMYFNGYLRDWLFYANARIGHGTQKEHEDIARLVREALRQVAPATVEAWEREFPV